MLETRHPDGGAEWEIGFSPTEYAMLEDYAARAGVTVNQLAKNRLLGRDDNATTPH